LPLHPQLKAALAEAPKHDALTICASSRGQPWTISGFDTVLGREIEDLEKAGKVGLGLTLHGLRHTVGGLLRGITDDLDMIRRWLGQATLHMAIHYSEGADVSEQMDSIAAQFDPLGTAGESKL
jgi:integrase